MTGILFLSGQKDAERVVVVIAIMASEKCREEAGRRFRESVICTMEEKGMAAYIINIVAACLIGLLFVILGIRQCRSGSPVVMNTGEKPLKPEQLSDVKAWNTGHGKALIRFGMVIALTIGIFPVTLNFIEAITATIIVIVMVAAEIVWLGINHGRLERVYRIK
ncbi:MAG: hypothetical protein K2O97_14180 [Acetatifactor sp.]|nr:hypothetical protein [Acetatifactor sp.]